MGIGAAMAGGNPASGRQSNDFYPTPVEVTQALLAAWRPRSGWVWEPACGDGAMARVIESAGYRVVSSDIADRGYGTPCIDFLAQTRRRADCLITNPPFDLAAPFIEHAFRLGVKELALVLKSTYWHAAKRHPIWLRHPPSHVMPLLWRPDFLGRGGPTMEIMWCVWSAAGGYPRYIPLPRPKAGTVLRRRRLILLRRAPRTQTL